MKCRASQAAALRAAGIADSAISVIPDEQEAIEAALRMGEPGDLLLIFADALARSWKQITKFKSNVATGIATAASTGLHTYLSAPTPAEPVGEFEIEGFIRDERGISMAPASDD